MIEQSAMVKDYQQTGSQRTLKFLLGKYEPLIYKTTHQVQNLFKDIPLDFEELKHITSIEFEKLIVSFDEKKGMKPPSYFKNYLKYGLINYVKRFTNGKHMTMNFRDDLDKEGISIFKEKNEFIDSTREKDNEELVELALNQSCLTNKEEFIVRHYWLKGKSISEISKIVNLTERKVYYYNAKALNKMSKFFSTTNI